MWVSIFRSCSLQPCQNDAQSPGEGHLELMSLGEVFLGAFFLLFPIEILSNLLLRPAGWTFQFGGSISPSSLSYLWRMRLLNQRFSFQWTFAVKSSAFGQICGFFEHLFHIFVIFTEWDFAAREFLRVFFLFYSAQCVLCKVYFSVQPNKLRPILKLKKYYPIEHVFVPACSSARKIHSFKF